MNNYETMFIIKADLKSEVKDKLLKQLNDDITKQKGKIEESKVWTEKQKLAYRIKRCDEGLYYMLRFSIMSEAISKLKQIWKINENIIRFLILR